MQVRMTAFSHVSGRFPRMVRDVAQKLGKQVELEVVGEDAEVDRNIIEALADPLVHVVRNAIDHGIETPDARLAAGKPAAGRLTIRASQEADSFVVEIRDDGRGIDPQAIRRKLVSQQMVDEAEAARLSDRDVMRYIFVAGFSTAAQVSDLSGRGVGMDVVRTTVEKLSGSIELDSVPGAGTCLRIRLPLSMALTQVLVVEADRQLFGVPATQVLETVRLPRAAARELKRQRVTVLRDRIVPLRALHDLLGLDAAPRPNQDDELALLVARVGGRDIGLLVDGFHGCQDVVQKPLDGVLAGVGAYSGTALLGDGSVLMVLDLAEVA